MKQEAKAFLYANLALAASMMLMPAAAFAQQQEVSNADTPAQPQVQTEGVTNHRITLVCYSMPHAHHMALAACDTKDGNMTLLTADARMYNNRIEIPLASNNNYIDFTPGSIAEADGMYKKCGPFPVNFYVRNESYYREDQKNTIDLTNIGDELREHYSYFGDSPSSSGNIANFDVVTFELLGVTHLKLDDSDKNTAGDKHTVTGVFGFEPKKRPKKDKDEAIPACANQAIRSLTLP